MMQTILHQTKLRTGIAAAAALAGGPSALARLMGNGVKRQNVQHWIKTARVPVQHCTVIEQALAQRVRRWDLRPEDWSKHWPELREHPDAPAPMATSKRVNADAVEAEAGLV